MDFDLNTLGCGSDTPIFAPIPNDIFERISHGLIRDDITETVIDYTVCSDCKIQMCIDDHENSYYCPSCSRICRLVGTGKDPEEYSRKSSLSRRRGVYTANSDNSKAQIRQTCSQLINYDHANVNGIKIQHNILYRVAVIYNTIQRAFANTDSKFIHRSRPHAEILGNLIYYECIRAGVPRKKRDIAMFMMMPDEGISRGCDILQNLYAEGIIDLPFDKETTEDITEKYLTILQLDKNQDDYQRYKGFVIDLIHLANRQKLGLNSLNSSKVVGAIWILVQYAKLPISVADIEQKCDKIRKNTFSGFSKIITSEILKFIDVFHKYNIPHGYEGRLKRVAKPLNVVA